MYKHVNGVYANDDLSVSKTVRLYPETLKVIEGYRGGTSQKSCGILYMILQDRIRKM